VAVLDGAAVGAGLVAVAGGDVGVGLGAAVGLGVFPGAGVCVGPCVAVVAVAGVTVAVGVSVPPPPSLSVFEMMSAATIPSPRAASNTPTASRIVPAPTPPGGGATVPRRTRAVL
jgi:hypothetical protein